MSLQINELSESVGIVNPSVLMDSVRELVQKLVHLDPPKRNVGVGGTMPGVGGAVRYLKPREAKRQVPLTETRG
jgi:hypothetical protein